MASKKIFSTLLLPSVFLFAVTKNPYLEGNEAAPDKDVKDTLLVYTGSINNAYMNINVGIHIEIAPDVGIRYETIMKNGTRVMSHKVLFYKFAEPDQSIQYNYLTGNSSVNKSSVKSAKNDKSLILIGTEKVDNYKSHSSAKTGIMTFAIFI